MPERPSKPVAEITDTDVVQFVVHGAMVPTLASWLRAHGFEINPWPHGEDELDTYMVTPGPELMRTND